MAKKKWVFRSEFPKLSVYFKGAPRDHVQFKGAKIYDEENGKVTGVGLLETEDPKLAKHIIENVRQAKLVEEIDLEAVKEEAEEGTPKVSRGRRGGKR